MEEQRSIFHANVVPLKYSIRRVTRACPPSSSPVYALRLFLFTVCPPPRWQEKNHFLLLSRRGPRIFWFPDLIPDLSSPDPYHGAAGEIAADLSPSLLRLPRWNRYAIYARLTLTRGETSSEKILRGSEKIRFFFPFVCKFVSLFFFLFFFFFNKNDEETWR